VTEDNPLASTNPHDAAPFEISWDESDPPTHTFKPGDRVQHKNGWEGTVVDSPVGALPGWVAVVVDGAAFPTPWKHSNLTLISDRYEPVEALGWCSTHGHLAYGRPGCKLCTLYRLVPPPHQHHMVCKECGAEG
jgi:hypothetical protein